MICPYSYMKTEQVSQDTYTHDESGNTIFHQNKLIEKRKFAKCKLGECGTYRDGECRYGKG